MSLHKTSSQHVSTTKCINFKEKIIIKSDYLPKSRRNHTNLEKMTLHASPPSTTTLYSVYENPQKRASSLVLTVQRWDAVGRGEVGMCRSWDRSAAKVL